MYSFIYYGTAACAWRSEDNFKEPSPFIMWVPRTELTVSWLVAGGRRPYLLSHLVGP